MAPGMEKSKHLRPFSSSAKAATSITEATTATSLRFQPLRSKVLSGAILYSCIYSCLTNISMISATEAREMNAFQSTARPIAFCGLLSSPRRTSIFDSRSLFRNHFSRNPPASRYTHSDSTRQFSSSSSSSSIEETFSVEVLAKKLADSQFSKIVAVLGAGASCSAGIPDFRTPGTGLYDKLGKYKLPVPEAIFDLGYYTKVNPLPFVDLCQDIWPGQEGGPRPTPTHHFLKLLEQKGFLHRIYTQNIDGLEGLAGVSTDKLVECHGHFRSASCTACKTVMPIDECKKSMVENGDPPSCSKCGSLVKPDIVFFGEEMPSRFVDCIDGDTRDCDLLLVFGTSLLVMPVAGIPGWVECPRVLFNLEPAGGIGTGIAKHLRQDLFLQGDCDANVRSLCDLAGWSEDLETLISNN